MSLFTPNLILENITEITLEMLQDLGIRGLVLDVDNTLTTFGNQEIAQEIAEWLDKMKQSGIPMMIASNNTKKRVMPFAQKVGLDYSSMSCKPLTRGLQIACKRFGLKPSEMAIVGDQIYTDIVGGNLKGFYTILVKPFQMETAWSMRLKRKLEVVHIRKYYKRQEKRKK